MMILFLKVGNCIGMVTKTPFTGWYAQFDKSDEPRMLCSFVDGKKNGFTYLWDGNGVRRFQGEYLDNLKNGQFLEWNEYAIQTSEKNYKLDKLHGSINFGTIPVRLNSTQSLLGENYWRPEVGTRMEGHAHIQKLLMEGALS